MDPHINPSSGVWDDNYYANIGRFSSGSADSIISNSVSSIMGYVNKPAPYPAFSFDEALAKAASTAEYSPYYQEKLSDYTTKIERDKARSPEDLNRTLAYLQGGKEYYEGSARRVLDLAVRKSNEGYAGQGLFFAGARERDVKKLEEETGLSVAENKRQYEYNTSGATLANKRNIEDLNLDQSMYTRDLNREKEYAIEGGVLQRKSEALQEYTTKQSDYYTNAGLYG